MANKNDLADILDTYSASYDRFDRPKLSAIGAHINQRASQCNVSQGQGRSQNYRSNNVMSENKSFKSSETSHVGYDHMAKTKLVSSVDVKVICGLHVRHMTQPGA